MIDRTPLARALAKATAHADAGNAYSAAHWAAHLVYLLGVSEILDPGCFRVDECATEPTR